MITTISVAKNAYKTSDGEIFYDRKSAERHESGVQERKRNVKVRADECADAWKKVKARNKYLESKGQGKHTILKFPKIIQIDEIHSDTEFFIANSFDDILDIYWYWFENSLMVPNAGDYIFLEYDEDIVLTQYILENKIKEAAYGFMLNRESIEWIVPRSFKEEGND